MSCCSNLYSHNNPSKLLESHLLNVANIMQRFSNNNNLITQNNLNNIVYLAGISHDLGKSTDFFQNYLFKKEIVKKKYYHGLLSSVFAFYITQLHYPNKWELPFINFIIVKNHHSDLNAEGLLDFASLIDEENFELLKEQINNINDDKFNKLIQILKLSISKQKFLKWVNDNLLNQMESIRTKIRTLKYDQNILNYLVINTIFSLLLDADKSDVVIKDSNVLFLKDNQILTFDKIEEYKKKYITQSSFINTLREQAYQETIKYPIDLNQKIHCLNLPTGLGKTITSFAFALKLREKLEHKPRIIYCLPFLSIIDQNAQVFEKILSYPSSNIFLKHHHLTEIKYTTNEFNFDTAESKILIEGWNAECIITTFVQFFQTIISNQNSNIRKLHKIANSIIILDEIQSIPLRCLSLFKTCVMELTTKYNCYIILSTATFPLIFGDDKKFSIIKNEEKYFSQLNRTSIKPMIEKNIDFQELLNIIKIEKNKKYLFIFNTINSAKTFYYLLPQKDKTFLSTHLIPQDRLTRINEIKNGKYSIVVSTQLIEAGVDIDFDVVIRDIAPLDSIIQSAGRCNRHNNQKIGEVYIISLKYLNKNGKEEIPSHRIYDHLMIEETKKILRSYKNIFEQEFLKIFKQYYINISQQIAQNYSLNLIEAINRCNYEMIGDFSFIQERNYEQNVFIEKNEQAKEVWQWFINLHKIDDIFQKKLEFEKNKNKFYQFVISVPQREDIEQLYNIGYISMDQLDQFYDKETGFKTNSIQLEQNF